MHNRNLVSYLVTFLALQVLISAASRNGARNFKPRKLLELRSPNGKSLENENE